MLCVLQQHWLCPRGLNNSTGVSAFVLHRVLTWRELRFPVILLLMYSGTTKVLTILHDASLCERVVLGKSAKVLIS